jgi:hypothetical protein
MPVPPIERLLITPFRLYGSVGNSLNSPTPPSDAGVPGGHTGWLDQLIKISEYFAVGKVINAAVSGSLSSQTIDQFDAAFGDMEPLRVTQVGHGFEESGINDAAGGILLPEIITNRRAVWARFRSKNMRVWALAVTPNNALVIAENDEIDQYPNEFDYHVPYDLAFPNPADTSVYLPEVTPTHLNPNGQQKLAIVIDYIRKSQLNYPAGMPPGVPGFTVRQGPVGYGTNRPKANVHQVVYDATKPAHRIDLKAGTQDALRINDPSGTNLLNVNYLGAITAPSATFNGGTVRAYRYILSNDLARVTADGRMTLNPGGFPSFDNEAFLDTTALFGARYAGAPVVINRAASGHTAHMEEWQAYSGVVNSYVDRNGSHSAPFFYTYGGAAGFAGYKDNPETKGFIISCTPLTAGGWGAVSDDCIISMLDGTTWNERFRFSNAGNLTFPGSLTFGGGATLTKSLTALATLDFGSTAAQQSSDLTVAVTGAAVGDTVVVTPPAAPNVNTSFTGFVSAADVVTVRFNNYSAAAVDPASGAYRVAVLKF